MYLSLPPQNNSASEGHVIYRLNKPRVMLLLPTAANLSPVLFPKTKSRYFWDSSSEPCQICQFWLTHRGNRFSWRYIMPKEYVDRYHLAFALFFLALSIVIDEVHVTAMYLAVELNLLWPLLWPFTNFWQYLRQNKGLHHVLQQSLVQRFRLQPHIFTQISPAFAKWEGIPRPHVHWNREVRRKYSSLRCTKLKH